MFGYWKLCAWWNWPLCFNLPRCSWLDILSKSRRFIHLPLIPIYARSTLRNCRYTNRQHRLLLARTFTIIKQQRKRRTRSRLIWLPFLSSTVFHFYRSPHWYIITLTQWMVAQINSGDSIIEMGYRGYFKLVIWYLRCAYYTVEFSFCNCEIFRGRCWNWKHYQTWHIWISISSNIIFWFVEDDVLGMGYIDIYIWI